MAMSIYDEINVVGDAHGVEVEPIVNNKKKPNLGNENRQLIYQFLTAFLFVWRSLREISPNIIFIL
jgi:hypothetical protein